jgi:Zn finger protein HypA/HybF involved in hydrogenase expression
MIVKVPTKLQCVSCGAETKDLDAPRICPRCFNQLVTVYKEITKEYA